MEMRSIVVAILAALAVSIQGCGERDVPDRPASDAPGDWCAEHGVPESACTLCNPALVPAFQARGDWCAEHGLPESLCPLCRAPASVATAIGPATGAPPADGTKVRFRTLATARQAGLELAAASAALDRRELAVTARIVYDAALHAHVNARAPGVVREVHADIGARVESGTALATIESAEVGAAQARLQAARSRVEVAATDHARLAELHQRGLASARERLVADQELDAAQADLAAAEAALRMVGSVADGTGLYTLQAPIAGTVTARNAAIGRLVDTDEILFEIARTSRMWAEIGIPEAEAARVRLGQQVCLTVEGLTGDFCGELSYVAPEVDPHTRTAKGRIALDNPAGSLRANMFARARIELAGGGATVLVPRAAVQEARGAHLVFLRLAEDLYEARHVQLGSSHDDLVEVAGRIAAGDRIVTTGSFLLKTETLAGSIGAGCCEVEGNR